MRKRRRSQVTMLVLIAGWALLCGPGLVSSARGQLVKGAIEGTITDPSGAMVAGAEIVAVDPATSSTGKAVSQVDGTFRISLLAVGSYNLTVSKPGFQDFHMVGVQVDSAASTDVGKLQLLLGNLELGLTVVAKPPLLEATQAQVNNILTNPNLMMLPTVGQNEGMDFLAVLLPGIDATRGDTFANANGVGFSSNGIRGRNNDEQIDGQNNNDNSVAGPGIFFADTDWVQEYQLTTSNFAAEYSRDSGSVVNIVTRSGTNDWHGDVFVTENSWKTAALTNTQKAFEGLTQAPIYNDEFSGVSVGGPVRKNRIFLFAGFDNEILPGSTVDSTGSLEPTPSGLQTLLACLPNSGVLQALSKYGPYAIPGGNPQPQASSLTTQTISGVTCSNGSALGPVQFAGVQRTLSTPHTDYDWIGRTDYQGSKDRIYARYIHQAEVYTNYSYASEPSGWSGYPINIPSVGLQAGLDWTRTLSLNMVNDARLSFGRLTDEFGGNSIGNTLPNQNNLAEGLASVSVPQGYAGFGYPDSFPQGRVVNTYQLQDNFSWLHGKHTVKAGANLTYQRTPSVFLSNYNGTFTFNSLANYVQDIPSSISITLGNPDLDFREHDNFLYVGDDFKASRNLTLNLSLSYSYFGQPANLFHQHDEANETSSAPFFNPSLPLAVRVSPDLASHKADFGPGVGFAYAPHGGKTVVRGGYRLTYDPAFYNNFLLMAISAPQVLAQTLTGAAASANPLLAVPLGPQVRSELAPYLTLGVLDPRNFNETTVAPNFGPDHVDGWSLGVERQLSSHAVFESRYIGNRGSGLFQSLNANPYVAGLAASFPSLVPSGVTPCPAASAVVPNAIGRESCNVGSEDEVANSGVSFYSGWQNELRAANLWNQLTLRTSFTWSKTTDNTSEVFSTFAGGNTDAYAQNPFDTLHGEHGLSGIDFPDQWALSYVEILPFYRGQLGWLGHAMGGWSISGSYILSSGQPYTPVQYYLNYYTGGTAYDTAFDVANIGVYETARPFLLTPTAPAPNVAIYGADLCAITRSAGCSSPNQLFSWNAFNAQGILQTLSAGQARFLVNGAYADSVYHEPWGTAGRNILRDADTNQGNFQISKDTRITERVKVRFDVAFLNVFNHPNFYSVDPFIEDAGFTSEGRGFGLPSLTSGGLFSGSGEGREVKFGLRAFF